MIKIYEVMALEHGLPLFFIEHINRLKLSIANLKEYSTDELLDIAVKKITPLLTDELGYNVKLTYADGDFSVTKQKGRHPPKEAYSFGSNIEIFDGERYNPLIKQENLAFRELTEKHCKTNNLYDVILRNKQGYLTEGSRSNFLLIDKNNRLITSQIGEALNGVTRDKIFKICNDQNITVLEKNITENDLLHVKSLIITGTSPGILPIKSCGHINFNIKNNLLDLLIKEYLQLKRDDIKITKRYFNCD